MKKIAFIIVRYGAEVNGGAEVHCRMLAERLLPYYQVEVLTTTVRVFNSPSQDYPEGTETENGVLIRRFRPQPSGDMAHYKSLRKKSKTARRIRRWLYKAGLLLPLAKRWPVWDAGTGAEMRWMESMPTCTPSMMRFIAERQEEYAALLFMNFYFSQTVIGTRIAPQKSILIPLAHKDNPLFFAVHTQMFTSVRHIAFNTPAEQRLCEGIFGPAMSPGTVVGAGIDLVETPSWEEVKAKYGLPDQYVLFMGRITKGKIQTLLPDFVRYLRRNPGAHLVLAGNVDPNIRRPNDPNILFTGFVSEQEKSALISHATVMVNPSPMESLSLLLLEAMHNGVPSLVNGHCEVMKDHCLQSKAALYYTSRHDFDNKLHRLLSDPGLRAELGANGPEYVRKNYDWEVITGKLRGLIDNL